jgi:two-component system chemotaxis sensor kinase CheA
MGELRQEFLKQTVSNLESLQREFQSFSEINLSNDFLQRFFRALHTIKGTAKTFDVIHLSQLAHEIENLVQAIQANQIDQNEATEEVFYESFAQLLKMTRNYQNRKQTSLPIDFIEHLQIMIPNKKFSDDLFILQIPPRIISKLSLIEKDALNFAIQKGKTFYFLKISFALLTFYEDFKTFKELLNTNGEVIAVASDTNKNPDQEVNFQFFFVSDLEKDSLEKLIADYCAKIEFENAPLLGNIGNSLAEVLENLVKYGKKTAQFLNKAVAFETSFSPAKISDKHLILLNEIASQLLHNAIDHGIESVEERTSNGKNPTAKIKINFENLENEFLFEIEDDGAGIDIEKILAKAKEKGLLDENGNSGKEEAIEAIFSQGFSTSETVSQISGRGVGLDAVKDLVEGSGGRIEVKTNDGFGSTFSVYLPQK